MYGFYFYSKYNQIVIIPQLKEIFLISEFINAIFKKLNNNLKKILIPSQ
jgi:hypothetical protein